VAISALRNYGIPVDDGEGRVVESSDIVKGHREMTLVLLWNLAAHFQVDQTAPPAMESIT